MDVVGDVVGDVVVYGNLSDVRCPDSTLIAITDLLSCPGTYRVLTNHWSADCSHTTPTPLSISLSHTETPHHHLPTVCFLNTNHQPPHHSHQIDVIIPSKKQCNSWGRRIFTIYDHNYRSLQLIVMVHTRQCSNEHYQQGCYQ